MSSDHLRGEAGNAFAELGHIVLGTEPLPDILARIVHIANHVLPGTTEASITLVAADTPATVTFTAEVAAALDERQYENESGPCLDAAQAGHTIVIPDMARESRWPKFADNAIEHGILSSLSVALPVQRQVTGALNFYATERDGFSVGAVDLAETFAGHAAVAVANAQLYETTAALAAQMREAMSSRAVIEQAKGIVMRDRGCSPNEAFDALVHLSQTSHLKLRDVAQRLVDQVVGGRGTTSHE